jgi:hypothetical protein
VPPPNFSANSSSNSKVRCKACNKLTYETLEIRHKIDVFLVQPRSASQV